MSVRRCASTLVLASLAGCLAAVAVLQDGPREAGERALQDRDYARAAALLVDALGAAKDGRDEILYLLAVAQAQGGKSDEALATLDRLLQDHPGSALRGKARFKRGDVLAAKKDFAAASAIYDDGLKAIVDPARRKSLAAVYVDTAREFLVPKDPKDSAFKPDHAVAHRLLSKALELEALDGDAEANVRADAIHCHSKGLPPDGLIDACLDFEAKFPSSPRLDEVLFAKGEAGLGGGDPLQAEKAWSDLADRFPKSPKAAEALLRAAELRVPAGGGDGLRAALRYLRRAAKEYPSAKASLALADALATQEALREEARAAYRATADAFPKDELAAPALRKAADLHAADGDDVLAIEVLEDLLKRYPDSPAWTPARQRIADLRFDRLRRARLRKDWAGLREAAQAFADGQAADPRCLDALSEIGAAWQEEKKFKEAVDAWLRVAAKYAGSEAGDRARLQAATLLVDELGDVDAALRELERLPAAAAAGLTARLRGPALALAGERVFTSAEAPAASLTVRNLETLRFRLWTLDVRDYFDRKGSTAGLQDLEVAVIAPDLEWEFKVPGYAPLKEFKLAVPLPKKDPGAYVVLVSAGALEAKTVVLVSDLAFVARAGRGGAVVLAQNQRTGEAVAAPALLSAADGKMLKAWTAESDVRRLSFFASVPGHASFRDLDLSRLPPVPKRAAAALILPDRGIVRAGEDVRVRIWIRDAAGNAYVAPQGKTYRLEAVSPAGLPIWETELTPSPTGAASAAFRLPEGFAGGVQLRLFERSKPQERLVAQTAVRIGTEMERRAHVDFLRSDVPVFAGDPVEVLGVLRDAWGRPLPGRRLEVKATSDPKSRDLLTGADGTFVVPIRNTEIFGRLGIVGVRVEHAGVSEQLLLPVFPRSIRLAFEAESRFQEDVGAGEARTAVFTAKRADGSPAGGRYAWTLFRVDAAGAREAVVRGEAEVDAQGRGSFAFTPKLRGGHLLRITGRDADGIPSTAQERFEAYDDGEERKLRILTAAEAVEPGVPFEVTILSRLEEGLGFVTVEGETIQQVLPVKLGKGRTVVKLGPPPGTSRDFSVTVSAMRAGKFHLDVRPLLLQEAALKIEPARAEGKPGQEITVKVTARPGSELLFTATERLGPALPLGAFLAPRPGEYFLGDSSVETAFAGVTRQLDAQMLNAMARLGSLEKDSKVQVMLPTDLPKEDQDGAGAGEGRFGQAFGGRRSLTGRGGGGRAAAKPEVRPPDVDPLPLLFASAVAGPDGVATFSFRLPFRHADVALAAWSLDGANRIAAATETLKVRAAVDVVLRAPASAVEGEASSIVALLCNRSAEEREVVLALAGVETRLKVPARSTLERSFPWTAVESVVVGVDGLPRELRCRLRSKPSTWNESGGAFVAKTELKVEGEGKFRVRYATSPEALLDGLAAIEDSLSPASDAAARLIARLARHRIAKSGAARLAVMEFAAWRALNIGDAAGEDEGWPVLLYLAAAEAKADGFEIETQGGPLKARFARAAHDDVKALQLFALARGGETQYGYLHRLWRNPDALSARGLACVALALKSLGKPDEAKDAAAKLAARAKDDHWEVAEIPAADLSNTNYVATSLAALALAEIEPASPLLPKARAWLLARSPSTAFERAGLALVLRSAPERSAVTALRIGGLERSGFGEVVADAAVVEPVGQGTFYALARRATGKAPELPEGVSIRRIHGWPGLVVEGEALTAVLEDVPAGPAPTRVAAGESFPIRVEVRAKGPMRGYRVLDLDELAGLRVRPSLRVLLEPTDEVDVRVNLDFDAYADAPGAYAGLEVLAAGAAYREGWIPAVHERIAAGGILFAKKKWAEARDLLLPVFASPSLDEEAAVEAAQMLAFAAAELGDHAVVVRYFEVLKEKAPTAVVPFDKIRAVGRAYAAAKEFERAMQVVAGTCDAYFLQEANLSGALEDLGRRRAATDRLKALLLDHPDTALNREMQVGLGTRLASAARTAGEIVQQPQGMSKSALLAEAAAVLERFLAWHPDDKGGDRAALTLGSVHLEAGSYAKAERASTSAAARHPKSRFLDGFDYTTAYARFAQRKFAEALEMCERLESFDYGADGQRGPAVMRERGILMKAQIHHSKGELDKALENYRKVKDGSPDAARSIAFLEREAISVPATTLAPLAKPAEIELEHQGVAEAHLRVYKVDLTMLALRKKDLTDPAAVEVAGIRPVLEKTFKLDVPNAKRREKQKLALDLKAPGAYLVGVKAGDFFAGGLVLRSDLALGVQEEGVLRVNVTNAATGAFVEGVKVTVVGRSAIDTLKTDLRGIAESGVDQGGSTVVAEKDGHVAMHVTAGRYANVFQAPAKEKSLDALQEQLKDANKQAEEEFQGNQRKSQQGVEVERTKR